MKGKKAVLTLEPAAGGEAETLEADVVLVAIAPVDHSRITERPFGCHSAGS